MSRKGKMPVELPKGVEVKVEQGHIVVKGPKGSLTKALPTGVVIHVAQGQVTVELDEQHLEEGHLHGLWRSLVENLVIGTTRGFEKKLEMVGVGYRAAVRGHEVDVQVGLSHPTSLAIPTGVEVKIEKNTLITVIGVDKQVVGQFAATIRAVRPPEPYQGKGIRYKDEYVRKKAGKAAGK